jgi:hypothetical protein
MCVCVCVCYQLGCDADELSKKNDLKRNSKVDSGKVLKYTAVARGGVFEGLACLFVAFFFAAWNQGLPGWLLRLAAYLCSSAVAQL